MQSEYKISNNISLSRVPVIFGMILIYVTAVLLGDYSKISVKAAIIFSAMVLIQLLLYSFCNNIFKKKYWIYFLIQGILVFNSAVIMPKSYETILLGMIPVLIFQSIMLYKDNKKIMGVTCYLYTIFFGAIWVVAGWEAFLKYIPILVLITLAVRLYSALFLNQIKMRTNSENTLRKLEFAYERVEELTLVNERQRVANDLQGTLSQGLSGIVMQLEAANVSLESKDINRCHKIICGSMEHARKTLADSRLVLADLRGSKDIENDIHSAIRNEVSKFRSLSDTSVTVEVNITSELPVGVFNCIVDIVTEGLGNIAKHANARNADIKILEVVDKIYVQVEDDGKGFNVKRLRENTDCCGLKEITKMVREFRGEFQIDSKKISGTKLSICLPIDNKDMFT